jgi:hypothetical protein
MASRNYRQRRSGRPTALTSVSHHRKQIPSAHQHRGDARNRHQRFDAPEIWHEPVDGAALTVKHCEPGLGFVHALSADDIKTRIAELPERYTSQLQVVQLSSMTRKRQLFPCYGLQWGIAVYLYPIEESLEELYTQCPRPAQRIETEMFGGRWVRDGKLWRLIWTHNSIRDFYLNNVLIHEIGHINDDRNTRFRDRERFADWFALEYGFRASRKTP